MSLLTYDIPIANEDTSTEEPKIITALQALKTKINGDLKADNLADNAAITLSQLIHATAGQLPVANASGVFAAVTMSGDATMNSSGVVSVAANSIGPGELNVDVVNNAMSGLDVTLSNASATALTGTSHTCTLAAAYKVTGIFDFLFQAAGGDCLFTPTDAVGYLTKNGAGQSRQAILRPNVAPVSDNWATFRQTVVQEWMVLAGAGDVLSLSVQASRFYTGNIKCLQANTALIGNSVTG